MDENARRIVLVVGISTDVSALVDHEASATVLGGKALGHHGSREARTDNQDVAVEHTGRSRRG